MDFHEIYFIIFLKSVEEIQDSLKSNKNNGNLNEDQYTFLVISLSVLLRVENVSDKLCRENQNIRFIFNNIFENPALL
jgi:hypothetical protein